MAGLLLFCLQSVLSVYLSVYLSVGGSVGRSVGVVRGVWCDTGMGEGGRRAIVW